MRTLALAEKAKYEEMIAKLEKAIKDKKDENNRRRPPFNGTGLLVEVLWSAILAWGLTKPIIAHGIIANSTDLAYLTLLDLYDWARDFIWMFDSSSMSFLFGFIFSLLQKFFLCFV